MQDPRLIGIEAVEPFRLSFTTDLYSIPEPEMLVDCLLPKGTITGVTSYPGVGKTWFAMELMRSLSTGGRFL